MLEELAGRIRDEPLFHLMSAGRELFSSNILAWFFNSHPAWADEVFVPLTLHNANINTPRTALREYRRIDLTLRWPGYEEVELENKTISYPDEVQLANYGNDRINTNRYLLSLMRPGWQNNVAVFGGRQWKFMSHGELSQNILVHAPPHGGGFEHDLITHYACLMKHLQELIDQAANNIGDETTVNLQQAERDALGHNRLIVMVSKARYFSTRQMIDNEFHEIGVDQEKYALEVNFTNNTPLINCWYHFDIDPNNPGTQVGWQLQGNQFRLTMQVPHLAGPNHRQERENYAGNFPNHFNFGPVDGAVGVQQMIHPHQGFCHYNPCFVYRYQQHPHITVGQLKAAAVAVTNHLENLA
ncbi:MAG TPA: hypothetical protein GX405_16335 [Rhizobiales bacterium]|nr:hypothetical protein [Hyphomicrobiales bacterium]